MYPTLLKKKLETITKRYFQVLNENKNKKILSFIIKIIIKDISNLSLKTFMQTL